MLTKTVSRPWGIYIMMAQGNDYWVKLIHVSPNQQFSLQSHKLRSESWAVIAGAGIVTIGDSEQLLTAEDHPVCIFAGIKHRMKAGPDGVTLFEIALGCPKEEDIIRYEDEYGRCDNG